MASKIQYLKRQVEDENENNEYEQKRKKNIEEKMQMLKQLGILEAVQEVNASPTIKTKRSPPKISLKPRNAPLMPVRRSSRLLNKPLANINSTFKEEEVKPIKRTFFKGPECMIPFGDDIKPSLADLLPYLTKTSQPNAELMSLENYKVYVKKFTLKQENVKKVGTTQCRSLVLHPSKDKLLALTGDKNGFLGFWDVEEGKTELYRAHKNPIFCLSVCAYNPTKLYATSIDGVVRSCDLQKMQFNDVYVTDPEDHTPYHAQMDAHTLLVAHGSGSVALVDERVDGQVVRWVKCHEQSVRTVHRHPFKEHEFATASRVREAGIWDVRKPTNQKPLMLYPHPKGLKSAFFSPSGGLLLTSCNDDKIRLYAADKPQVLMSRSHNMQTGRWLNPFQATWHPHRDDTYIIGSLNKPRQVDVCGIHGLPIAELRSHFLLTVLSNCQFHPSIPFIAGVNNSGYVHIFTNSS